MTGLERKNIALLTLPALSLSVLGFIAILDFQEVCFFPFHIGVENYFLFKQFKYFFGAIVLAFIATRYSHHFVKNRRFIIHLVFILMILPFTLYGRDYSSGSHWIHINSYYRLYVGPWVILLLIPLVPEFSIRFRENPGFKNKKFLFFSVITALFAFQKDWAMLVLFVLISIIMTYKDKLLKIPSYKQWIIGMTLFLILPVGYLWQSYGSSPAHVIENTCGDRGGYQYHLCISHDFRNYIIKLVSIDIIKNAGLSGIGFQKFRITGNKCQYAMLENIKSEYAGLITIQQMGLNGLLFVVGLYGMYIVYGIKHLRSISNPQNRHIGLGMLLFIGIQAYLGILKPLNIIPAPPYSLPFLAYGFNSIASSFIALGILVGLKKSDIAEKSCLDGSSDFLPIERKEDNSYET